MAFCITTYTESGKILKFLCQNVQTFILFFWILNQNLNFQYIILRLDLAVYHIGFRPYVSLQSSYCFVEEKRAALRKHDWKNHDRWNIHSTPKGEPYLEKGQGLYIACIGQAIVFMMQRSNLPQRLEIHIFGCSLHITNWYDFCFILKSRKARFLSACKTISHI